MHLADYALPLAISAVVAYLLGSISFSIIFTKIFASMDVRSNGSGNAGATNVLRTVGKLPAALTFICDFLKCVAAMYAARAIAETFLVTGGEYSLIVAAAGVFCMIGHIFPLYFGFRGGRGITVGIACAFILDPRSALITIAAFVIVVALTKMVSAGSIAGGIVFPVSMSLLQFCGGESSAPFYSAAAIVIGVVAIIRHRENIKRILSGTEPKIGEKHRMNT